LRNVVVKPLKSKFVTCDIGESLSSVLVYGVTGPLTEAAANPRPMFEGDPVQIEFFKILELANGPLL
jgi:hypothetical protein